MAAGGDAQLTRARRWAVLALWTAVIYAAVPYANRIQAQIAARLGAQAIRVSLSLLAAGAALAAAVWLARRRRALEVRRLLWIVAITAVCVAWAWRLKGPGEPAHLVQYGILGALAFRAFSCHFADRGVYLAAAALTAILGTVDEILQWLSPGRFWGLDDIGLNAGAGILVQLLIFRGIRPAGISVELGARSLRAAVRLAAVEVVLVGLCLSATPSRIEWIAERVPGLSYLGKSGATRLVEYGHRYVDPEIGRFQSRFAPAELEGADRRDGVEAAKILDRFPSRPFYREFQLAYPPGRHPLVFEARSHLFYRDRLWQRAGAVGKPGRQRALATGAYRENLILERYFPNTLASSHAVLEPAVRQRMEKLHQPAQAYASEVSDWLVTGISEAGVRWILLAALALLLGLDRYCSRRFPRSSGGVRRSPTRGC